MYSKVLVLLAALIVLLITVLIRNHLLNKEDENKAKGIMLPSLEILRESLTDFLVFILIIFLLLVFFFPST